MTSSSLLTRANILADWGETCSPLCLIAIGRVLKIARYASPDLPDRAYGGSRHLDPKQCSNQVNIYLLIVTPTHDSVVVAHNLSVAFAMSAHSMLSFLLAFLLASFVVAQDSSIVNPTTAAASATALPSASGYTYLGCYNETVNIANAGGARALPDMSVRMRKRNQWQPWLIR